MVPQAGARGTGPSEIRFDYASRVKPGKVTWQRGFRLKDEEYRANMVYLKKRLQRSRDIEWDDHMKTNTNTQAIDQIVYNFKAKFRSFWDTIPSEPWVDWALRGMVLTEARRMRKRKAAEDQKAGSKKDRHKTKPESSDNDAGDLCHDEAADTDAEESSTTAWRGSAVGGGDDKQRAVYPPAGSSEMVTIEIMVLFWGAAEMTDILHDCTIGDISCASSPEEWRPEHLDYGRFMKQV